MRSLLSAVAGAATLAILESTLARWLPRPLTVPVIFPLLQAAALTLPHRSLFPITLLGGVAAEVGSGLPAGVLFGLTVATPYALRVVLRRPRPDLPGFVKGILCGGIVLAVLGMLSLFTDQVDELPREMIVPFAAFRLVIPAATAGLLALGAHALLQSSAGTRALHRLGVAPPPW